MLRGKSILSCGCEYTDDMGDMKALSVEWDEEICTRDPDNPFANATFYGQYCPKCRRPEMRAVTIEKESA